MPSRVSPINVPIRVTSDQLPADIANAQRQLGQFTADLQRQFQSISSGQGLAGINMGDWTNPVRKMVRSAARGNFNEAHMEDTQRILSFYQNGGANLPNAGNNANILSTLIAKMNSNRLPTLTGMAATASPLWSNQMGAASGSITGDLTSQNLLMRMQGIEGSLATGGRPTARMVQDLQEAERWFKRSAQSANEFREALGRLEIAKNVINNLLPPGVAANRLGPAGMQTLSGIQPLGQGDWYGSSVLTPEKSAALAAFARATQTGATSAQNAAVSGFANAVGRGRNDSSVADALFNRIGGLADLDKTSALRGFSDAVTRGRRDSSVADELLGRIGNLAESDKVAALAGFARSTRAGTMAGQNAALDQFRGAVARGQSDQEIADAFIGRVQGDNRNYYQDRQRHFGSVRERELADDAFKRQVVRSNQEEADRQASRRDQERRFNREFDTFNGRGLNSMVLDPDMSEGAGPGRRRLTSAEKNRVEPRWQNDQQKWRYEALTGVDANRRVSISALESQIKGFDSILKEPSMSAVHAEMQFKKEFLGQRINAIQGNPVLAANNRAQQFRGNSLTAMNIGYGIEDFVIASQYGGVPMGIRAAVNNVTPIIGSAVMAGKLAGWAGPAAIGGAAIAASGVALGTEWYQQRVQRQMDKEELLIRNRTSDARFSRDLAGITTPGLAQGLESLSSLKKEDLDIQDKLREVHERRANREKREGDAWFPSWDAGQAEWEKENTEIAGLNRKRYENSQKQKRVQEQMGRRNWETEGNVYDELSLRTPIYGSRTVHDQIQGNLQDFSNRVEGINATWRNSDRGPEARKAREIALDAAVSQRKQADFAAKMQGREDNLNLQRSLKDELLGTPEIGASARRMMEGIMGNDGITDKEKLASMMMNRDVLARNMKNIRTGQGEMLPEQETFESGTMAHAQYLRRLTAPQDEVDQRILDVLQEINDAIQKLMDTVGVK